MFSDIDIEPASAGVLWRLERDEGIARCTIHQDANGLELRVRITNELVTAAVAGDSVATVAERWRDWLRGEGWTDPAPAVRLRRKPDRRSGLPGGEPSAGRPVG